MARRRRSTRRAPARRTVRRSRRRSSKSNSFSVNGIMKQMGGGAVYGAVAGPMDAYVTKKLSPMLGFAGQYADNVARIAVLYAAGKYVKNTTVKKAAMTGLAIEGAVLGSNLTKGITNNNSPVGGSVQAFSTLA